jgi:hypothetical protein
MMGNFYLINETHRWACVCISKNACTSLKRRVLEDSGLDGGLKHEIHDRIGYSEKSPFLAPVAAGRPKGCVSFAVWRDPVERFLSTYRHFAIERIYQETLAPLRHRDLDCWIDYAEAAMRLPPLEQDEHIRAQSAYYAPGDVDWIVPIQELTVWFQQQGWGDLTRENTASTAFEAEPEQAARIQRIYRADYDLLPPKQAKPFRTS